MKKEVMGRRKFDSEMLLNIISKMKWLYRKSDKRTEFLSET
jgi:hypothetical protein